MKELEIVKHNEIEDTYYLKINNDFSIAFSKDDLKNLSTKINEFIEKETHLNYHYLRNKKTGRLEKIFD